MLVARFTFVAASAGLPFIAPPYLKFRFSSVWYPTFAWRPRLIPKIKMRPELVVSASLLLRDAINARRLSPNTSVETAGNAARKLCLKRPHFALGRWKN